MKRPLVQRPIKKNRGPPPVRTAQKLQAKLDARAERTASGVSGSSHNEESESDLQDEIQLTSSDDEEITEDNFKIIFSKKHPDPLEADLKFDTHKFTKGFFSYFTLTLLCISPDLDLISTSISSLLDKLYAGVL